MPAGEDGSLACHPRGRRAVRPRHLFGEGDAEGAWEESWTETLDGVRLTEPAGERTTWLEFQQHASMPVATTTVTEETIEIPAGRYDCLVYTRREEDAVSRFWFAKSAPGMPLKFEQRRLDGSLVFSSTAIEDVRP